jgi:hypothetical protein
MACKPADKDTCGAVGDQEFDLCCGRCVGTASGSGNVGIVRMLGTWGGERRKCDRWVAHALCLVGPLIWIFVANRNKGREGGVGLI